MMKGYPNIRGSIVRVGFSKDESWISRLIRRLTKAPCSHAYLIVEDEIIWGRKMLAEASAFGVRVTSLARFQKANTVVADCDCGNLTQGMHWLADQLGDFYDFGGLLGMAYVLLRHALRWTVKKVKNPLHSPRALFCSELVTRVLQESRYPGADKLVADCTSPGDLLAFLKGEP